MIYPMKKDNSSFGTKDKGQRNETREERREEEERRRRGQGRRGWK